MIRVLHVTTTGRMGGAERLLVDVVRHIDGRRCESLVTTLTAGSDLPAALYEIGVGWKPLGLHRARDLPAALVKLLGVVRYYQPDIIHTHLLHASALGAVAAIVARIPLIKTRHFAQYLHWYGSTSERAIEAWSNRRAHAVLAISNAVAQVLTMTEGIPQEKVFVVPNGIDVERVRARGISTRPRAGAGLVIGNVASLEPRKGQIVLVRALGRLVARGLDLRLVLVGAGPMAQQLHREARTLGIEGRVEFAGYTADPYPLMASFDIYAQPSLEEGFGIAVLEAMALEKPIVATNTGGLTELVTRDAGLLVMPASVDELSDAIAVLAEDPAMRSGMGLAGASLVNRSFTAQRTAEGYVDVYEHVIDARESVRRRTMPH